MTCDKCGVEIEIGDFPFCPHGRGYSTVVGDEMDHVQVNGTREPIRFRSKQARKRWMKANGLRECAYHIGLDGSDKSKHTRRWEAMDAQTLENARILVERAAQEPTRNEPKETPLKARLTMGELNSPEFEAWRHGR